ncbi:putative nuclear distribution protein RO10 [Aspergillus undulatus]|uniref:putative nuclear distribution protein RO10 n=1 Tax=Aspergillus undulatus TaxID=1810928 RepID=UPI003CCE04CA
MTQAQPPAPEPLSSINQTTASTLFLLESRLHRLTYLLTGDTTWSGTPEPPVRPSSHDETVARRLAKLEGDLEQLKLREGLVGDLLGVYDRFPDLFKPSSSSTQFTNINIDTSNPTSPSAEDPSTSLSPHNTDFTTPSLDLQKSIILSYATTIPETASRLTSLSDTPIPDATLSTNLISQIPRMEKLALVQDAQAKEIAELRVRSAKVLQRFYEVGILGGGEVWGEWEARLESLQRELRRGEVRVAREGV